MGYSLKKNGITSGKGPVRFNTGGTDRTLTVKNSACYPLSIPSGSSKFPLGVGGMCVTKNPYPTYAGTYLWSILNESDPPDLVYCFAQSVHSGVNIPEFVLSRLKSYTGTPNPILSKGFRAGSLKPSSGIPGSSSGQVYFVYRLE